MNKINKIQLKKLVADCNTRTALDILSTITKNDFPDKYNTVVLLLSQYNLNFENSIKGVAIDKTVLPIINDSILKLIDELKGDTFEYQLLTTPDKIIAQQESEERNQKLKNRIRWILTAIILFIFIAGYLFYQSRLPRDPLGIAGKWDYIVTPSDGEKLLGEDTTDLKFKEMYDKIIGWVEIKPIEHGEVNYKMEGQRTDVFVGNNPVPNSGKDLFFEEISYSNEARDKYTFRFGVSILRTPRENSNQGFVRLSIFQKEKEKVNNMRGIIYYLYKNQKIENQLWREVSIEFRRNNNK